MRLGGLGLPLLVGDDVSKVPVFGKIEHGRNSLLAHFFIVVIVNPGRVYVGVTRSQLLHLAHDDCRRGEVPLW